MVIHCILLHGLCNDGSMVAATEFFRKIEEKEPIYDEVFYATVISGFCKAGETRKALKLLKRMCSDQRIKPNRHCFNAIVDGLCKGRIDKALSLFQDMINYGHLPDAVRYTSLIHGLCKFGFWEEVMRFLVNMLDSGISPTIRTYNSLIYGLCHSSQWSETIKLFEKMKDRDISPDVITYSILVDALCKGRRVQAQKLFQEFIQRYKEPGGNAIIYSILIKGYSLQAEIDKAQEIFEQMTSKGIIVQDVVSYCTLVGGGNIKVGRTGVALKLLRI
ncbi:pentatricopeptide repeat-containing protein At1g62910-like [Morus notabilis]|uniref:pentatricopeptide repeat-containing protein At1g62910-like n=1 Tax=Morus notabilis TaxID=981085 RepID=UPI000CED5C4D|nr:pentatricopeptide repeat-containing protein At1g62910-like [Morus notabilis]